MVVCRERLVREQEASRTMEDEVIQVSIRSCIYISDFKKNCSTVLQLRLQISGLQEELDRSKLDSDYSGR